MESKLSHAQSGAPHLGELKSLRRIEGQIRGVTQMIQDERYCVDILQQMKAIKAALARVERNILDGHLGHCVHAAIQSKDPKAADQKLDEIKQLIRQMR